MVKKLRYIITFLLLVFIVFTITGYAEDGREIFIKSLSPDVDYKAEIYTKIGNKTFVSTYLKIGEYEGYIINIGKKEIFVVKKGDTIGININLPKGSLSFLGLNMPKKDELILKNYNIEFKGEEEIIGRKSYHIALTPLCEDTVSEEVWVDSQSYISLKTIIYDWNKKPIKEKGIRSLTIYKEEPSVLSTMKEIIKKNPKTLHKWFSSYEEAEKSLKTKILKPKELPCGYELIGVHVSNRFKDTIHIVYSNGIGYISLYEKRIPIWARRGKGPQRGPHPDWEKNGRRLLLVGDVKEDILYRMAKSIK